MSDNWLELLESLKGTTKWNKGIFRNPRRPATRHGWTDEVCLIEGQKYCVWKRIPENEVEGHLISFVNLWFGIDSRSSVEICCIIRNALLMAPLGISNDLLLKDVLGSATDTAKTPPVIDKESMLKEPIVSHLDPKERANVLTFHEWLKPNFNLLKMEARKTSKGQPRSPGYNLASQKLRAVVGFCALLLMRLHTKHIPQFRRHFSYLAWKMFDRLFPEAELNVLIAEPEPKFLKLASSVMRCNSTYINMFYLLVFQYLKSTAQDNGSSKLTREILEVGCLEVLEGQGVGLVTLFQDVEHLYPNMDGQKLLSTIAKDERDMESSKRLVKFLSTYTRIDKPQYSWKWARILSQNYFSDMNIRENRFLCCKFAALLVDTNPGIFKHRDLKTKDFQVNSALKWAETAKQELQTLNEISDGACFYIGV